MQCEDDKSNLGVEDLALASLGRGDEVLLEDFEDVLADVAELRLHLLGKKTQSTLCPV